MEVHPSVDAVAFHVHMWVEQGIASIFHNQGPLDHLFIQAKENIRVNFAKLHILLAKLAENYNLSFNFVGLHLLHPI